MREIKFRAWEINKMISWLELCGIYKKKGIDKKNFPISILNNPTDLIFMQFTGIKDKNGKEIYEGDIIKIPDYIKKGKTISPKKHVIKFKSCTFHAEPVNKNGFGFHLSLCTREDEIVGNIYEDKEMIK